MRSVLRSGKILMQTRATLRNALRKQNYELPGVSNDMQSSETLRNSLGLNYKSAALPTELCRRFLIRKPLLSSSSRIGHHPSLVGRAKDVDASEENLSRALPVASVASRVFVAESARAVAEELGDPLGTGWVLAMALVSVWRSVLSSPWPWQWELRLVLNLQSHPGTPH
jgi:hypothetical protein